MREFFRIVRSRRPAINDFMPVGVLNPARRPRYAQFQREFEEGVSVYDDFAHACGLARANRFRHGAYIVRVAVPEDGSVEFKQTFAAHHYTIYAEPDVILALADEVAVHIQDFYGE